MTKESPKKLGTLLQMNQPNPKTKDTRITATVTNSSAVVIKAAIFTCHTEKQQERLAAVAVEAGLLLNTSLYEDFEVLYV